MSPGGWSGTLPRVAYRDDEYADQAGRQGRLVVDPPPDPVETDLFERAARLTRDHLGAQRVSRWPATATLRLPAWPADVAHPDPATEA